MKLKNYLLENSETRRHFAERARLSEMTLRTVLKYPKNVSKRTVRKIFFATNGLVCPEDFWGELGRFSLSLDIQTAIREFNLAVVPKINARSICCGGVVSVKLAKKISALTDGELTVWELIKKDLPGIPDYTTSGELSEGAVQSLHKRLNGVENLQSCQKIS